MHDYVWEVLKTSKVASLLAKILDAGYGNSQVSEADPTSAKRRTKGDLLPDLQGKYGEPYVTKPCWRYSLR